MLKTLLFVFVVVAANLLFVAVKTIARLSPTTIGRSYGLRYKQQLKIRLLYREIIMLCVCEIVGSDIVQWGEVEWRELGVYQQHDIDTLLRAVAMLR
jgi:hypothetical protein